MTPDSVGRVVRFQGSGILAKPPKARLYLSLPLVGIFQSTVDWSSVPVPDCGFSGPLLLHSSSMGDSSTWAGLLGLSYSPSLHWLLKSGPEKRTWWAKVTRGREKSG